VKHGLSRVVKELREKFPPDLPVRVYFVDRLIEDDKPMLGLCERFDTHYRIKVRRAPHPYALMILVHEWAHALAWTSRTDHNNVWARKYSELYGEFFHDGT
jgi:hypothetical protein